uniref:Galectin n=1 Tax=Rhipicephalus appendiculatus TaxID=34631 RepID=Q86GY9_RHIAP|nr:midgut gallectin-like protein [Rhipicephalus appendiculatus]
MQMTAAKVWSVHSLPLIRNHASVIFEPAVPMDHPLENLQPGTIIELSGHVLGSPKRFSINLVTASGDHRAARKTRFDVGNTVFNTLRNDDWEEEEVVPRLPVQQGHNFDFMILVEEMGSTLRTSSTGCSTAWWRGSRVDGCVTIHRVEQRPPLGAPVPPMEGCQQPVQPLPIEPSVVYNPPTLLHMLPGGRLTPGLMVYVSGRPHSEATSFSLNFQCGGLGSDIAFHFNPRFHRKEMVRNSFQDGDWGTEGRKCHGFPFTPGVHFDVLHPGVRRHIRRGRQRPALPAVPAPAAAAAAASAHFLAEGDVLLASCKFQLLLMPSLREAWC